MTEHVTDSKNSSHVTNSLSLEGRSLADSNETGELSATDRHYEAHKTSSVFEIGWFVGLKSRQEPKQDLEIKLP